MKTTDVACELAPAESSTADTQITGNIGMYFCCYQFSIRGWNAMPTSRNARGVDIVIYSRDATRFHGVQVKALSKRVPVPLGNSLGKIMGDFWVIVNKVATPSPGVYVMLPEEVRARARMSKPKSDGSVSYWLQPADYCVPEFHNAWERIGLG